MILRVCALLLMIANVFLAFYEKRNKRMEEAIWSLVMTVLLFCVLVAA